MDVNKDAIHQQMNTTPEYWFQRPLTNDMLSYIVEDVVHLFDVFFRMKQLVLDEYENGYGTIITAVHSHSYADQLRTKATVDQSDTIGPNGRPIYGIDTLDRAVAYGFLC